MKKLRRGNVAARFALIFAFVSLVLPRAVLAADTSSKATEWKLWGQCDCISSDAALDAAIARLKESDTRMEALDSLIECAGPKLYQSGSVIFSSGSKEINARQVKAVKAILESADIETVTRALDSTNRRLQFWGVWFWPDAYNHPSAERIPWLALMPKIMHLAAEGDEGIRFLAVERLQPYPENKKFRGERLEKETSAHVLLRLVPQFGDDNQTFSQRFNPYLLRLLNHADKKVRRDALNFIGFNGSMAEMFQIDFDESIIDRVMELMKSETEEAAAAFALAELHKQSAAKDKIKE